MKSEQAESLDLCMNLLFEYIKHEHRKEGKGCDSSNSQMFKILMENFETMMLPAHNTHHVQFLLFYFCSFDVSVIFAIHYILTLKKYKNLYIIFTDIVCGIIYQHLLAKVVPL